MSSWSRWARAGLRLSSSTGAAEHGARTIGGPAPLKLWYRGVASRPTLEVSHADIESLIDHVTRKRVKVSLEELQKPTVHVDEFLGIAARNGLDQTTGRELLRSMADAGNVLYMPDAKDQALRETVVLDTSGMTGAVTKLLEMSLEREVEKEVSTMQNELKPYKEVSDAIERRSRFYADLLSYGGLGLLVTQFGIFFHLTFFELSWDIMEPVSYFFGQATTIAAYSYFLMMKRDHTHEDMWNRARRRRRERLFAQKGLSYERFRDLTAELSRRQLLLKAGQPPSAAQQPVN